MEKINLKNLAERKDDILVSIYLPTHRTSPENKQDRVRYKNLLDKAYDLIQESETSVNPDEFLKEAIELRENINFWEHATEGLAVLVDKDNTEIIKLTGNTPERVVVGNRFHILPLINYYELPNDYYLLDVSKDRFNVYTAGAEGIEELETKGIYNKFDELYDDKDIESDLHSTGGSATSFHGHKAKPEIDEKETEKYLRYLSKELTDFFKAKGNPIVLFGTVEVVSEFKEILNGGLDIYATIEKPLVSLNQKETFENLKEKLLPKYVEKVDKRIEGLQTEIANDRGTDNASRIKEDAKTGRVDTLFMSKKYDEMNIEDLDEVVANVITNGGEVIVVDEEKSEFPMGIGATYRY